MQLVTHGPKVLNTISDISPFSVVMSQRFPEVRRDVAFLILELFPVCLVISSCD